MKKTTFVAYLVALAVVFAFGIDYFAAMRRYEKLRTDADSPLLQSIPIKQKEQEFLRDVQDSWFVRKSIWPDDTTAGLCELVGFEPTIDGFLALHTHEVPPFSIFDKERNLEEAGRAGALSQFKHQTTDNRIYWKKGVAYMIVRENIVDCYEDTDNGIRRTIYTKTKKPNKSEQATPRNPSD